MEPIGSGPAQTSGQPDPGAESAGGVCGLCGRELPAPDLEAVAASIDQTLSMETGRMVARTAWAGHPPDGAVDALLSWLPSVKARRRVWERGQQLWTEQMTAALSGPCDDCRAAGLSAAPGADMVQPAAPSAYQPQPASPTEAMPSYESATAMMPSASAESGPGPGPSDYDVDEGHTTAMPAYSELSSYAEPAADLPTSAMPAFPGGFGAPSPTSPPAEPVVPPARPSTPPARPVDPPPRASDEHESHTMILSSLPSIRTTTRLVVLDGPVHGRQFSLGRQLTTIGRSIGCHVTVESDDVAYDHARIVRTPSGWQIEPISETTGLWVNDEPIGDARPLRNGDVVRVGSARLRFESTGQAG